MDDQQRLQDFLKQAGSVDGLGGRPDRALPAELQRSTSFSAFASPSRVRIAMFDAKSYDLRSFARSNDGPFAVQTTETSLNVETAQAATGCMVACIFVNVRCDEAVIVDT